MAVARTDRGPASSRTTSGTGQSASSGSFTPAVGNVLVVVGGLAAAETAVDLSVSDSFGAAVGSWTVIKSSVAVAYGTASCRSFVAWATVDSSPSAGTVTVTRTGGNSVETLIGFTALEFSDVDLTTPVAQSTVNNRTGAGASLATNLSGSPAASSWLVGSSTDFWGAVTIPAALSALDTVTSAGTDTSHEATIDTAEDSTPSGTSYSWAGSNGDAQTAVLVEIQITQTLHATPTPAAIALAVALPAVTALSVQLAAPAVIALAVAMPAVATNASGNTSPDPIALSAALPAVSAVASSIAAPATIARSVVMPAVTVSAGSTMTPATIALAFVLHTPQLFIDSIPVFAAFARDIDDADLLDLTGVSVRTDAVVFELLDNAHNVLGEIHPEFAKAAVENATDAGIKRRLSGLVIAPHELADIDTIANRLRVRWVLENGSVYPLGIFLFADDRRRRYSFGQIAEMSLVDQGLILDQPLSNSLGWAAGTLVRDAMIQTAEAAGISAYTFDLSTATLGSDVAYSNSQSNTYAKVLDYLCGIAGFHPAYFNNDGVLTARVVPDLSVARPSLVYGTDESAPARIISGSMVESNDLLTAPNRYLVVDNSITGGAVVATYDLPSSAPHSIAKRGFAIPKVIEVAGVGNVDQALEYARAHDASTPKAFETVSFSSPADPRHDTFDLITYRGTTYVELAWRLALAPGGPMDHSAQRVYV